MRKFYLPPIASFKILNVLYRIVLNLNYFNCIKFFKPSKFKYPLRMKFLFHSLSTLLLFLFFSARLQSQTCPIITHSAFTTFNSSINPGIATTIWLNIHTKLSAELAANGDYVLYHGGTVTLTGITASFTTGNIPDGKIIADNTVSTPVTYYDTPSSTWITKVPLSYNSNDIFI